MKKKFTFLILTVATKFISAQSINESFTAPFNPASAGWVLINNSTPSPVNTWAQGSGSVFPAFSGGQNDYFSADWRAAGSGSTTVAGISNWLITPTVTISNGAKLSFVTRRSSSSPVYPDRLIVRMSTSGTSTTIPTGSTSVGPFTNVLLDINPSYSSSSSSVVAGSVVNGYPTNWAAYTLTITGITGNVTGRFAFHYFVDDGGFGGSNSDYIGLDNVQYTLACNGAASNFSVSGSGLTYNFTNNSVNAVSYLWNFGDLSTSTQQNPPTKVYTSPGTYIVELDVTSLDGCVLKSSQTINATGVNSISENIFLNTFIKLAPNPTDNNIILTNSSSDIYFNESIDIYNSLGISVKSINNINAKKTIDIDVSDLPSGMYYLNAKTSMGNFAKLFIKN